MQAAQGLTQQRGGRRSHMGFLASWPQSQRSWNRQSTLAWVCVCLVCGFGFWFSHFRLPWGNKKGHVYLLSIFIRIIEVMPLSSQEDSIAVLVHKLSSVAPQQTNIGTMGCPQYGVACSSQPSLEGGSQRETLVMSGGYRLVLQMQVWVASDGPKSMHNMWIWNTRSFGKGSLRPSHFWFCPSIALLKHPFNLHQPL